MMIINWGLSKLSNHTLTNLVERVSKKAKELNIYLKTLERQK